MYISWLPIKTVGISLGHQNFDHQESELEKWRCGTVYSGCITGKARPSEELSFEWGTSEENRESTRRMGRVSPKGQY